ncbi:MAG: phage tail protein [Spirulinaceae cyanobacterium]
MSEPFLGQIQPFAFNFAPRGWAMCNGQLLPIAQNTALFSLIGTIYGGDGRTTFALPDLRGRTALHQGNGPGLSNRTIGSKGGEERVTLNITEIPSHGHSARAQNGGGNAASPQNAVWAEDQIVGAQPYSTTAPNISMSGNAIGDTGGGQPHDNMQPFLVITYCIALIGIYPSRS